MKLLRLFLLSSVMISSQVYAECTASINELFFGDIMVHSEPEFNTNGYVDINCATEDIGKTIMFSFDKSYISSPDNSINLPIDIIVNNITLPINVDYSVTIQSLNTQIPIAVKLSRVNVPSGVTPGIYSSTIMLKGTY